MGSIDKNSRSGRPRESRTLLLSVLILGAATVAGCGGEVRSESDIPEGSNPVEAPPAPELTERSEASVGEESRWAAAAYVAERASEVVDVPEPAEEPVEAPRVEETPRQSTPAPAPRDDAPVLVATDTDEGQIVDFEPSAEATDEFETEAAPEVGPSEPEPLQVEAGAELVFTVEADLSTQDNRPGDVFYAYLADDFVAEDGMVLLPRGVRARGRVVETIVSDDSEEWPVLEVVLEELIGPEADTPILATVLDAELESDPRDSDGESVVKVLTGAAAGAILGRVLGGDGDDALKGGLAGAAAGAAVAYGTRGGHAKLPAGGHLTIRLEEPLIVF